MQRIRRLAANTANEGAGVVSPPDWSRRDPLVEHGIGLPFGELRRKSGRFRESAAPTWRSSEAATTAFAWEASGHSQAKVGAHMAGAAPINFEIRNVRYSPKSGHSSASQRCPLCTSSAEEAPASGGWHCASRGPREIHEAAGAIGFAAEVGGFNGVHHS